MGLYVLAIVLILMMPFDWGAVAIILRAMHNPGATDLDAAEALRGWLLYYFCSAVGATLIAILATNVFGMFLPRGASTVLLSAAVLATGTPAVLFVINHFWPRT